MLLISVFLLKRLTMWRLNLNTSNVINKLKAISVVPSLESNLNTSNVINKLYIKKSRGILIQNLNTSNVINKHVNFQKKEIK